MNIPILLAWSFGNVKDALGIGQAGEAAAKAITAHEIITAVTSNLQLVVIMVTVAFAVISLIAAAITGWKFGDSCREVLADGQARPGEIVVLLLQVLFTGPALIVLLVFGAFLAWVSKSGLMELVK